MTIDERLEMIVQIQATHEDQLHRLFEVQHDDTEKLTRVFEGLDRLTQNQDRLQAQFAQSMDTVTQILDRLANIANSHDRRISDIEEGRTQ